MSVDLIERIRGLCARLVEIAPWWAGRWTRVDERSICEFERREGIRLPNGYRRLLAEVGEPAPLPGRPRGGLIELADALSATPAAEWLGPLDRPFGGTGDEPVELEWDDEADAYADPGALAGCLPIAEGGGDMAYLLVVTGAERGRVWSFSPSSAPQLRPTGAELLDWYVAELERGLAPLETEAELLAALERRVADDPEDLEAAVSLGRRLCLRDRPCARALLERAWAERDALESQTELRRAIAELDLIDGRRDRIESVAEPDDPWLRTYAGIAAARAGEHARVIARIVPDEVPVLLRAAAIGWLAAAHAAQGDIERALELIRGTQASGSNHALAARLRASLGRREQARRSWREALASLDRSRRAPQPPSLADLIEIPIPDRATIEAAIAELERG